MFRSIFFVPLIIFIQFTFSLLPTLTHAQIYHTYSAFKIVTPSGDAGDAYKAGWGVSGTSNFKIIPKIDLLFEASWYNLSGKEIDIPEGQAYRVEDLSVLGVMVGAGYNLGFFQLGAKGGYFFDDLHEWDLLPYAQISFWRLAVGIDYKGLLGSKNLQSIAINLGFRWW